ncbi:MAG: class I SAM-dependent methyltransferase [Spirochaetia bacterium]|nr:class I SAM-dependent methyltransferase [Spirochaetia bacterium]
MTAPDNVSGGAGRPPCIHTGEELRFPERLGGRFGVSKEGVVYSVDAHNLDYGADYFLTEYTKQYGRTYEEDAPALRALAKRRLASIAAVKPAPADLFEIGAALGFFLDEARSVGYTVSGLEISEYACQYAQTQLHLNVMPKSFLKMGANAADGSTTHQYDVVAAFYVIEHFADQRAVFERISSLLRPGGVFAFALPSTNGPMFRQQPAEWVRTHPGDHFADYSPDSLRRILPHYGMELHSVRPASYHPSRARGLWAAAGPIYKPMADFFAFGDTMEGIAIKTSGR